MRDICLFIFSVNRVHFNDSLKTEYAEESSLENILTLFYLGTLEIMRIERRKRKRRKNTTKKPDKNHVEFKRKFIELILCVQKKICKNKNKKKH